MFKKNNYNFYKEVDYKFLYDNTLKLLLKRNFNKFDIGLLKIQLIFWYKHIPSDEFNLYKLYNNIMLLWLIFNQKIVVKKYIFSFRLNVYYNGVILISNINKKNIFEFFDLFVNGFLPLIRKISIKFVFLNQKLIVTISDLSFFASIKMGRFFFVENVTDNVIFNFSFADININNYLKMFKINNGISA